MKNYIDNNQHTQFSTDSIYKAIEICKDAREHPTRENIERVCDIRLIAPRNEIDTDGEDYLNLYRSLQLFKAHDDALIRLFERLHTDNADVLDMKAAVLTLNDLYSTRMGITPAMQIAIGISDLRDLIFQNLDDPIVVDRIANINKILHKGNYCLSFASKFCNFLIASREQENTPNIPIYDKYVVNLICCFTNSNLPTSIPSYSSYRNMYNNFRNQYNLSPKYTNKEIDGFLWMYGKALEKMRFQFESILYRPNNDVIENLRIESDI